MPHGSQTHRKRGAFWTVFRTIQFPLKAASPGATKERQGKDDLEDHNQEP
eukprot:CAMPEP_0172767110 /NCGR_PEP_ID=MMETSP1074-20121228/182397_1 /TAXON_ID=2916 /ORGANISM="Ceratium fusus, Strain PA161109" /LENGTH=49 /DNA_ID= /DNA_START= /DNA_END= /DNA_ORIENTATION=